MSGVCSATGPSLTSSGATTYSVSLFGETNLASGPIDKVTIDLHSALGVLIVGDAWTPSELHMTLARISADATMKVVDRPSGAHPVLGG